MSASVLYEASARGTLKVCSSAAERIFLCIRTLPSACLISALIRHFLKYSGLTFGVIRKRGRKNQVTVTIQAEEPAILDFIVK